MRLLQKQNVSAEKFYPTPIYFPKSEKMNKYKNYFWITFKKKKQLFSIPHTHLCVYLELIHITHYIQ